MENTTVVSESTHELLTYIDTNREIMEFFTGSTEYRCPVYNASKISFDRKLGEGVYGAVFDIGKLGKYVVKILNDPIYEAYREVYTKTKPMTLRRIMDLNGVMSPSLRNITLDLNGGDEDKLIRQGDEVAIVLENTLTTKTCKTTEVITVRKYITSIQNYEDVILRRAKAIYKRFYTGEEYTYPSGSYFCGVDTYSEYAIGVLCSELVSKGVCNHFIKLFGWSMCPTLGRRILKEGKEENLIKDYIFMERVDGDIGSLIKSLALPSRYLERVIDGLYLQTLFAIVAYQHRFTLQHNDLHTGNVFYKKYASGGCLEYILPDGEVIYLENCGYISKVGDFGLSVKYSEPMIGSRSCTIEVPEGYASELPGWRMDSYDVLYFTLMMFNDYGRYSGLLCRVMGYILHPEVKVIGYEQVQNMMYDSRGYPTPRYLEWYNPNRLRPTFKDHPLRASYILTNRYLHGGKVSSSPSGTIIKMGELAPPKKRDVVVTTSTSTPRNPPITSPLDRDWLAMKSELVSPSPNTQRLTRRKKYTKSRHNLKRSVKRSKLSERKKHLDHYHSKRNVLRDD